MEEVPGTLLQCTDERFQWEVSVTLNLRTAFRVFERLEVVNRLHLLHCTFCCDSTGKSSSPINTSARTIKKVEVGTGVLGCKNQSMNSQEVIQEQISSVRNNMK